MSELPDGAVVLNVLHLIEFIDPEDGEIYKLDLSHTNDKGKSDMAYGKQLEMIEWARAIITADLIAEMVHDRIFGDGDEEDEDA